MISIIELTEKKTPLIKNNYRKKGMTLVEVIAAMAILSILFVGISSLIINTVKIEDKSNTLLDNATVVKSILTVFQVNGDGTGEYITDTRFNELKKDAKENGNIIEISFNTISNIQNQLINGDSSDGSDYTVKITIKQEGNKNLYIIIANLKNNIKNQSIEKKMYINRS